MISNLPLHQVRNAAKKALKTPKMKAHNEWIATLAGVAAIEGSRRVEKANEIVDTMGM